MKLLRIALVLAVLLIMTMSVASADSPNGPNRVGRAEFLEGEEYQGCWIFDVDFVWYEIEDCSPTIALITNSYPGVIHWNAHAQLPAGAALPEQKAVHFTYKNSGFACWWDEGVETTNYSITITPKGKFIINCHFRPDKWQPD
jgi:hypothetical protein